MRCAVDKHPEGQLQGPGLAFPCDVAGANMLLILLTPFFVLQADATSLRPVREAKQARQLESLRGVAGPANPQVGRVMGRWQSCWLPELPA